MKRPEIIRSRVLARVTKIDARANYGSIETILLQISLIVPRIDTTSFACLFRVLGGTIRIFLSKDLAEKLTGRYDILFVSRKTQIAPVGGRDDCAGDQRHSEFRQSPSPKEDQDRK